MKNKKAFDVSCFFRPNKENENRMKSFGKIWIQTRACNDVLFYTKPMLKNFNSEVSVRSSVALTLKKVKKIMLCDSVVALRGVTEFDARVWQSVNPSSVFSLATCVKSAF